MPTPCLRFFAFFFWGVVEVGKRGSNGVFDHRMRLRSSPVFFFSLSRSHRVPQKHELDAGHQWCPGFCRCGSDATDGVWPRGRRRGGWEGSFFLLAGALDFRCESSFPSLSLSDSLLCACPSSARRWAIVTFARAASHLSLALVRAGSQRDR